MATQGKREGELRLKERDLRLFEIRRMEAKPAHDAAYARRIAAGYAAVAPAVCFLADKRGCADKNVATVSPESVGSSPV